MQDQISYETILTKVGAAISSSGFYWQSLSMIACFILAYICFKLSKKFVIPKIIATSLKKNIVLNRLVNRYLSGLLYPLFAIICLAIGLSIYAEFFEEVIIFSTTLKLATLFLLLRFLRISSNNSFVANIAGFFLIPALVLDTFHLLDPTITYLDQYAFEIGSFRVSIYLIIKGFCVLWGVFWLSGLVRRKGKSFIDNSKSIQSSTKGIISKLIDIIVYTVVLIILLKTFGVDMTTLTVIGGAVGVGIGFGLQKIASNFISGIILLFEKSVEIGDMVEIENGSIFGTVKHFGGRYTLVETTDGREIMIPNEDFIISKVINWTYSNSRARIEVPLRISYDSNLAKATEIILNAANNHPRCLNYPEADCFVTEFADYDIRLTLFFWISDITEGRLKPKSDILTAIWDEFQKNDIKIPLPQREFREI